MEIEFLLSFKDDPSFKNLGEDLLKKFSSLVKSNKKNKFKKTKNNDNKKSLTKVKEKLQISKEKIENKYSLLINKLDSNNIDKIIEEFITKFKDINEEEFIIFQKYIYTRILKDNKFQLLYLEFFMKIKEVYNILFGYNEKYFISLIEYKFKYDYSNQKPTLENDINLKLDDIHQLDSEENRINNLNLILIFIKNGFFNKNILDNVSELLLNSEFIPDIYHLISDKYVKKNYDFLNYHQLLKSKINDTMNNRYKVILNSILENFGIEYKDFNKRSNSITSIDFDNEMLNYDINLKTVESFEQFKSKIEIEIDNIIEEYLLIEDFEEINNYLENSENINNFMTELFNYYFKNNLNHFEKFKSLFLNFRNNNNVKSNVMIESLISILNSDYVLDYLNIETKIVKLLEIFKILQINLDNDQTKCINKLISS